jgi:YD repeat-containing protein
MLRNSPFHVTTTVKLRQNAEETFVYNGFGQKVRHVDSEGNVSTWEYDDADGDGVIDAPGAEPSTGGYLRAEVRDIGTTE